MLVNDSKNLTKCEFKSKTWFDIGKLIYNLSNGSDEGYRLWVMFSKMDRENFDESICTDSWDAFSPNLNLFFEVFEIEDYEPDLNLSFGDCEPEPLPEGW